MNQTVREMTCEIECGTQGTQQGTLLCSEEGNVLDPEEICNLVDDNCNGECDEGALMMGCRVQIHRGYGSLGHIYHSDLSALKKNPFHVERKKFLFALPK